MKAVCLTLNGIVCITLFLYQNIVEKVFMENCDEILAHTYDDYVIIKICSHEYNFDMI